MNREDPMDLWDVFAMFEAIGENTKSEGFRHCEIRQPNGSDVQRRGRAPGRSRAASAATASWAAS